MEVARVVRCCLLRAFPGFPLMEVIVSSWLVNVICFLCFLPCVYQVAMRYREFLSVFFTRMGLLMLSMKALSAMFPRLRWL